MHSADDLDYKRGYEWWLLSEAKARNPEIKTYGLPWAYPGWVGGPEQSGSPFTHPNLTSTYILKWLEGARDVYGVDIDFIGIWNGSTSFILYPFQDIVGARLFLSRILLLVGRAIV